MALGVLGTLAMMWPIDRCRNGLRSENPLSFDAVAFLIRGSECHLGLAPGLTRQIDL
jgi:hypothetical protein